MEAFGCATTVPWRMTSEYVGGIGSTQVQRCLATLTSAEVDALGGMDAIGVHPTFFYESLWCLLGFFLLVWMTKRRKFDGQMILVYTMWYGVERFVVEGLRTDSLMIGNLRVSQVFAIFSAIVALIIMLVVLQKKKASNDPEYLKLYVDTEEAQLIREGKFYGKKQPDWAENPVHTAEDGRKVEKRLSLRKRSSSLTKKNQLKAGRPQCPIRKKNRFRTKRSKDKSGKTNVESPFCG